MSDKVTAYIGIGGNVGEVIANMNKAINALHSNKNITVSAISKIYKTPPWGIENQDWFYNACFAVETTLTASELLDECLGAEKALKRVRDVRWGPRTIDLDVLLFGSASIKTDRLEIPHPRMFERAFVLKPLADIARDRMLKGRLIGDRLGDVDCSGIELTDYKLTLQNS